MIMDTRTKNRKSEQKKERRTNESKTDRRCKSEIPVLFY